MSPVISSAARRSACAPFHMNSEIGEIGHASGSGRRRATANAVGSSASAAASHHSREPTGASHEKPTA